MLFDQDLLSLPCLLKFGDSSWGFSCALLSSACPRCLCRNVPGKVCWQRFPRCQTGSRDRTFPPFCLGSGRRQSRAHQSRSTASWCWQQWCLWSAWQQWDRGSSSQPPGTGIHIWEDFGNNPDLTLVEHFSLDKFESVSLVKVQDHYRIYVSLYLCLLKFSCPQHRFIQMNQQ